MKRRKFLQGLGATIAGALGFKVKAAPILDDAVSTSEMYLGAEAVMPRIKPGQLVTYVIRHDWDIVESGVGRLTEDGELLTIDDLGKPVTMETEA